MTIIANPIYDSVFKFLMEDNRVAKVLLSALLQKDVLEVQMRQHEYTDSGRSKISLFRLDFSATPFVFLKHSELSAFLFPGENCSD